jgi:hypothetical protein
MAIAVTMMPDLSKGERWFCTEQEGVAAGWRSPPAKTVKNLCPLAAMRVERLQKRYAPHTRRAVVEVRSDVGPPRSFQPLRFFHQFAALLRLAAKMAATNKYLARSNKSRTGAKATKR